MMGGDLVSVKANLDGSGEKRYVMTLRNDVLVVVRVDAEGFEHWKLKADSLTGLGKAWGGGWVFKNEIYFANNKGKGVYQLDLSSIDLDKKTADFVKASDSAMSDKNDGLNCLNGQSPFPPAVPPKKSSPVGGKTADYADPPKTGEVRCLAKLTEFRGINLKPDPS